MAGLFTAIALREAGEAFEAVEVYEQTRCPTTAGAGLNIAPNGARLCSWLGIDLDGGDPQGPVGVPDGGRAAILDATRQIMPDLSVSLWPFTYNEPDQLAAGGGFHHMHRQDLLMCLHKRVAELGPESGVRCPITVQMGKRLASIDEGPDSVTATFEDGSTATGDVLIGADGIHSKVLELLWPGARRRRWTGSVIFRGLIPREKVETLRKRDGSPLDFSPSGVKYHDMIKRDDALCMTYWVRGGELLNVAITWYEPDTEEFHEDWGDWRTIERSEVVETLEKAWGDDPRGEEVIALGGAIDNPTKWGLYDRDALSQWQEGRVCLVGDAAHPMLPTFGQGASQSFEDGAALSRCFALHGDDYRNAFLHYERVRHYRATRFQFGSKAAFKHLEPQDSAARQQILAATDERDMAIFDHEERAGGDDSWIYAYDARDIGEKLPPRRLGPWDFRTDKAREARRDIYKNLWKPEVPRTGDHPVTSEELARHDSFEDCWVVVHGKVYDFTEWKDWHPGGSFVARLFAGKDATGEFGEFHSRAALRHMANFCVGPFVGDELPTGTFR
jgi:salicylate hydroxylase